MAERIAQIEAELAALKAAAAGTQQPQLQLTDAVTQQQQYRHTSHVTEQRLDLIEPRVDPAFTSTTDTCISCPFHEKDEAKTLGARWDMDQKRWFVPAGLDLRPFAKWMREREAQERRDPFRPAAPSRFALAPLEPPPPTRAAPPGYVTHDRHGNPLAKPRPPTRREKCAATMGKTHCNSAQTHAALTAAMLAGVELPKGKKRPRKR